MRLSSSPLKERKLIKISLKTVEKRSRKELSTECYGSAKGNCVMWKEPIISSAKTKSLPLSILHVYSLCCLDGISLLEKKNKASSISVIQGIPSIKRTSGSISHYIVYDAHRQYAICRLAQQESPLSNGGGNGSSLLDSTDTVNYVSFRW